MCTNCRMVFNPYIRKRLLVSCGKCEACQQEKANARALRIKNNVKNGYISLFVTLTYNNDFLPFVYRDDVCSYKDVPIYRSASVRHYLGRTIVDRGIRQIDSVWLSDDDLVDVSLDDCPHPRKMSRDKIGVIYYEDIKDFFKRLRIYLNRHGYDFEITYYSCAELGSVTKRPHFHLLLFVRSTYEEALRSAIVACWPFADSARTAQFIEIAKNAASYVASYVNSGHSLSSFYKIPAFRQKHSYSKTFGTCLDFFSLSSLLEKANRQSLTYNRITVKNGIPCITAFPIPKYVINRFFPKFKGYSYVTDDEIRKLLLVPERLAAYVAGKSIVNSWTSEEIHEFKVRLTNLSDLFVKDLGISYDEFWANYADWYCKVWNSRFCTIFRMSFDLVDSIGWTDFYENINELFVGLVHSNLPDGNYQINPNARSDILVSSHRLMDLYFKKDKSKKVVNYALSNLGYFV